ncbi:Mitochondrial potassium channel [Geodia barretti]|uniref:Mitochondrial potassium channel n=1 Tax=Geodia barretti TaxID=519541 RepID=A0AA35XLE2_GEOBA|nr:Mitochondrial potassium channel [Geodia barretti]
MRAVLFLVQSFPRRYSGRPVNLVSYVRSTTEELTGQNKVSLAQAEVRRKREELKTWRQSVSDATALHEEIQQRLRHVYAIKTQLYQAQRRDLAALQTINSEEESLLSEEQSQGVSLESLKLKERECFEALGDAILSSHEKERAQSEKLKYYSRLGSILGAVFGFAGSNLFLRREVRKHQRLLEQKMNDIERTLQTQQQVMPQHSPDTAVISQTLGNEFREIIVEENEKQMKELEDKIISQFYDDEEDKDLLPFLYTGLGVVMAVGICTLSYTVSIAGR